MPLPLTIDELIETIKRSSLPTILVEGSSDASIYRWIEDELGTFEGNIIPCGGRDVVLELYRRRAEYQESQVIFLADKDMWLFSSIPLEYSDVIWTYGYSIENDLFTGEFTIECLLDRKERENFSRLLTSIIRWFAFEVEKYTNGGNPQFYHPARVVNDNFELCDKFLQDIGYSEPREFIVNDIKQNYTLKLRGKTLLALYVYILNNPKRKSKYSAENIIELYLKNSVDKSRIYDIVGKLKLALASWPVYKSAAATQGT